MGGFESAMAQGRGAENATHAPHADRARAWREMELPATTEGVAQAIEFAKRSLEEQGFPQKAQAKLAVLIDEVVSSIAKYAYGSSSGDVTMRLSAEQGGHDVAVVFVDEGVAFDPLDASRVDAEAGIASGDFGGQGIQIIRMLADEVEYERKDGKNILRIRKDVGC